MRADKIVIYKPPHGVEITGPPLAGSLGPLPLKPTIHAIIGIQYLAILGAYSSLTWLARLLVALQTRK